MARPEPQRGEVWVVDLGLVAKMRPCLVLSVPDRSKFQRRIGRLTKDQLSEVEAAVKRWLGFNV